MKLVIASMIIIFAGFGLLGHFSIVEHQHGQLLGGLVLGGGFAKLLLTTIKELTK